MFFHIIHQMGIVQIRIIQPKLENGKIRDIFHYLDAIPTFEWQKCSPNSSHPYRFVSISKCIGSPPKLGSPTLLGGFLVRHPPGERDVEIQQKSRIDQRKCDVKPTNLKSFTRRWWEIMGDSIIKFFFGGGDGREMDGKVVFWWWWAWKNMECLQS